MKNQTLILLLLLLTGLMLFSGCAIESAATTPDVAGTAAAMAETIVARQLTQIAADERNQTATAQAQITPSPTPPPTPTPAPPVTVALPTPFPTASNSSNEQPCLQAHLVNETIPDGSSMQPGETFTKEWTLQNTGTCMWTGDFRFAFNHGDLLGAEQQYFLGGTVQPGESVTISIPMIAPAVPGSYLGFWTMQTPEGQSFGTASSGLFWVQINVEEIIPPTGAFDLWYPVSDGGLNALGEMDSDVVAGDGNDNQPWQGFVAFNLADIPANATILSVSLLYEASSTIGTPFEDLGCMGVYRYNFGNLDASDFYTDTPGGALWSFCSEYEIRAGAAREGSQAAIYEIQNSIGGIIQFRFQFNTDTDNDNTADLLNVYPVLRIEYSTP